MGKKKKKSGATSGGSYKIVTDPLKGRCLHTTVDLAPGTVVFEEESLVAAKWDPASCDLCGSDHTVQECELQKSMVPSEAVHLLGGLVEAMASVEGIDEVDRARQLLKLILMYRRDPSSVGFMGPLSYSNIDKAKKAIKSVGSKCKKALSLLLPIDLTQDTLAVWLAQLNNNSHELEIAGGSGLFPTALMMEHSCLPNCSFTTDGYTMYMTAVTTITTGTPLSIDYLNAVCKPVGERRRSLHKSYGFLCACEGCTILPDRSRSFVCQTSGCTGGVVYPVGEGEAKELWVCLACSTPMSLEHIVAVTNLEKQLEESPVDSIEAIDEVLAKRLLYPSHHLIFRPSEELAYQLADMKLYDASRVCWERVVASAEQLIPGNHHEKVIYHDHLAQVLFCLGLQDEALKSWEAAYNMSVIACGEAVPSTASLGRLLKDPPKTMGDLLLHYPPR